MPQAFGEAVLTSLISFNGTNGSTPEATLVQGDDGQLYGTTMGGGTNGLGWGGDGTVFRISTNGTLTTLAFLDRTYASAPQAGLVQGTDRHFYGTTLWGGTRDLGGVFKISPEGLFSIMAEFRWPDAEYANGLAEGSDGHFYGTALYGGTNGGHGSIFKVSTNGTVTLLTGFDGTNGAHPQAPLLRAKDGSFYGTTVNGGANGDFGTVFRVTPGGELSTLVSFSGTNGACPRCSLMQDVDGSLYGTTTCGGIGFNASPTSGLGTVFKLTPAGELVTLHRFAGYPGDGAGPGFSGLTRGTDGNFYGTTRDGGLNWSGTVFRITPDGVLSVLYSFSRADYDTGTNLDGCSPVAGLTQAIDGNFYGVTMEGGTFGRGTIFRLTITTDPPVLRATAEPGGTLSLRWNALPGKSYQVQCRTDFDTGSWGNFGAPITATNTTGVASDTLNSDRRFYRVVALD